MTQKLKGQAAIVTGAASPVGAEFAMMLAREGADVAVTDICKDQAHTEVPGGTAENLDRLVSDITSLGVKAVSVHCDVTKAADVKRMVDTVVEAFGKVDILVNNAGVVGITPVIEMDVEQWDLVMDVNLKGPFLCCKFVLPHMMAQNSGKIVNIGSVSGRQGEAHAVHYCCSKAGVHMLTDALSKEVAKYNINVNCVAPGTVWGSNMVDWQMGRMAESEEEKREMYMKYVKRRYTIVREQTAEDLSNAVRFLVSEESRNITGYTIYVDGGHKGPFSG
jgi:NAD(P)-dependent dehydrogenase (short-subunit alcohol dehydrogenase family)